MTFINNKINQQEIIRSKTYFVDSTEGQRWETCAGVTANLVQTRGFTCLFVSTVFTFRQRTNIQKVQSSILYADKMFDVLNNFLPRNVIGRVKRRKIRRQDQNSDFERPLSMNDLVFLLVLTFINIIKVLETTQCLTSFEIIKKNSVQIQIQF